MEDFYFKYKNKLAPEKGRLLISEPYLPDPNFQRSVVLLCEHNEEGSFGFVLNRPANLQLREVMELDDEFDAGVFVGGPVQQDTLHFLHTIGEKLEGSASVLDGLYWGGDFDQLSLMLGSDKSLANECRFFIGYSGWGAGQLEEEIEENSWIVAPGLKASDLLHTPPDDLWQLILKKMGGRFEMFSRYPADPRLN